MIAYELRYQDGKMRLQKTELGAPSGSQALIRTEYSGVSMGTEAAWLGIAKIRGEPPFPLGYSLVGVVEAVGPDADAKIGQRVLSLSPHASAALADASPGMLVEVPESLDSKTATLGALASVALHIVERSNVALGEPCVVFGHGVLGAFVAQLLRKAGAGWVFVVEPEAPRREIAMKYRADAVIDPSIEDVTRKLADLGFPEGVSLAIETAAHPSVFPTALDVLGVGGRLVLTSTFLEGLSVQIFPDIIEKELTLIGAHQPKCPLLPVPYYPYCQYENRRMAMRMLADSSLKCDGLITRIVPWQESESFYAELGKDRSVISAVLDWSS